MGRAYATIAPSIASFIAAQHVFFVASAPLSADGLVNLSPKGTDGTLVVLDRHRIAYLDLTGSGIETAAHVQENSRVTLMWCAFDGPPRIVRIHGHGSVVWPESDGWEDLRARFPDSLPGVRSIIVVEPVRISDSCGYAVPLMGFVGDRDNLNRWAERKGPDGVAEYQTANNTTSLDGLPGLLPHEHEPPAI